MSEHQFHRHELGDAKTKHYRQQCEQQVLLWALLLTLFFAVIETFGGWWSGSLVLISDASHMFTDAAALGLAWLAQTIARYPPSSKHSFGFGRIEALSAFVNCLIMLCIVGWIIFEALKRLYNPLSIEPNTIILVSLVGLMINLLVFRALSSDQSSVNSRAALLHVWGDLLGSITALIAGVGIKYTGWLALDPILSLMVSMLILKSTWIVLRDAYHFLMKGVPKHIDYNQVGLSLLKIDGVISVHDLHIWGMTQDEAALIGHIVIADMNLWPSLLDAIRDMLRNKYKIDHITLQAELSI